MPPASRKRSVSSPRRSDPRSERGGGGAHKKQAKGKSKNVVTKPLSTHGFSAKKRPKYNPGTKILLDETIYDDKVPTEVKGHFFLYEVSEVHDGGKTVQVQYKEQVIKKMVTISESLRKGTILRYVFLWCRLSFCHVAITNNSFSSS